MTDREARFRQLFETAYPPLRRYATNRGLQGADAEDLVASTFEVAWAQIEAVPSKDPLPWLFAVARNHLRNKLRSDERRRLLLARAYVPDSGGDNIETAIADGEAIRRAFSQLGEDDQELLRLIAWDNLSPAQAAAALGCGSLAVRSRLHRARNRLAALLEFDPRVQRGTTSGQIEGIDAVPNAPEVS